MKQIVYQNNDIYAATTLKDLQAPEKGNQALHVCIDPDEVLKNRRELAKEIGLDVSRWALPWQKHTANFYEVKEEDISKGSLDKNTSIMNTDALYTTLKNVLIGVYTADCVGLLIVDEKTPCIAAIHTGWKGTCQEIAYKTLKHLMDKNLIDPKRAKAYFSPSILFDSLEVGMEVVEQIKDIKSVNTDPFIRYAANEKAYIDNQGINGQMLKNLGFLEENIHLSSIDTKKDLENGFSFRNDKKTGEHFTYAFIK